MSHREEMLIDEVQRMAALFRTLETKATEQEDGPLADFGGDDFMVGYYRGKKDAYQIAAKRAEMAVAAITAAREAAGLQT